MRSARILSPEQHRAIKVLRLGAMVNRGHGEWQPAEAWALKKPIRTHTLRSLFKRGWICVHHVHKVGQVWERVEQIVLTEAQQKEFDAFAQRYKGKEPPGTRYPLLIQELVNALAWHSGTLQQLVFYDSHPEMLMATDRALEHAERKGFRPQDMSTILARPCGTGKFDRCLIHPGCPNCGDLVCTCEPKKGTDGN